MKICRKCQQSKLEEEFYKAKHTPDKLTYLCKACNAKKHKEWVEKNREKLREYSKAYREKNADKYREHDKKKRIKHAESIYKRIRRWQKANPEKMADYARGVVQRNKAKHLARVVAYQSARMSATPPWADSELTREVYELALLRTKATGIKWEVDHIVPLRSPFVCGLHWHGNLRVIPLTHNRRKSNKIIEDSPCGFW